MTFIPAFSEPQSHWPMYPPPPALGQSGVGARAAGVASRETPPVPWHRFSKVSHYHLPTHHILINRVVVASTSRIQRNPILEAAEKTHRTAAAVSSKGQ